MTFPSTAANRRLAACTVLFWFFALAMAQEADKQAAVKKIQGDLLNTS